MRNHLSTSLKILTVLFLLGVGLLFTPSTAAQSQTLTGWFTFMVADYHTESGLAAETIYTLTEDSGERHELLIDIELMRPLGGPIALNRKRVTVMGEWKEVGLDATEKFRVYSIELAPSPSTALPGRTVAPDLLPDEPPQPRAMLQTAQTDSHVRGSQAWVTILCRFADETDVTPYPVSHYEEMIPALGHYWKEVSYGNIPDLAGSVVVGWYNLPRPRSYYISDIDEEVFYPERLTEDCADAGDADVFFPDFDGINLVFNGALPFGGFGGSDFLTKDGQRQFYGQVLQSRGGEFYVLAHEMGHAFGLPHSSGPYDKVYDSSWDVMSGGVSCTPSDEFGCAGVHTISYHKDYLGWIPPGRKYVAGPNTTRTITLERLAQPGSDGYLMAQIPIGDSATDFYTVEARLFAGYDDGIPGGAVIIHKVDTTRGIPAQVVDVDNNGNPNDEGAMWTVGETFTDQGNGVQVSVDAEYATGFQVTITTSYSACTEAISPTHQLLRGRRGNARIQVVAPSGCRWGASSDSPWLTILTGSGSGNGSVLYSIEANPGLNARTGTLTIAGRTFTVTQAGVNDNLFGDDMENGVNGWNNSPPWALTTTTSWSGTHAWSSKGEYQDVAEQLNTPWIDLTSVNSATLTFWHWYDLASTQQGGGHAYTEAAVAVGWWVEDEDGEWQWQSSVLRDFTGTQPTWQQVKLDLTPFVGKPITLAFYFPRTPWFDDRTLMVDGWYIDDVAVYSTDFDTLEPPLPPQATLENPAPNSFQSGIAAISGWACEAQTITIELNGVPYRAGYPTTRPDTQGVCGDTDNGFSLLWNWNNLGPGWHSVRALLDGVEFAKATVQVTIFGEPFQRGLSGTFTLSDFPHAGDTTKIRWEESLQNFVIIP